jgi:hypothetical protein
MNNIKKLLIIVGLIILILFSISINDGKNMNSKQPLKEMPIECTETPALEDMLVMDPEDELITYEEVAEVVAEDQPDMFSAPQPQYSESDLMLLAKVIYAEAGSDFLSDEWKMCVGEVVLNRVASPEFPNTITDVVYQPGQYHGARSGYIASLTPSERCIEIARRLLDGERIMEPSVVFQANFKQGSGVYKALYDSHLGWTYLCYSTNMSLY